MSEFLENKCKNCGGALDIRLAVNGVVECKYCKTLFTVAKQETVPEALRYLHDGNASLDVCKFGDAFTYFQRASELDNNEPEAYFGMALAQFKVQYLKDEVNNFLQPVCHEISEKVFTEDKNYKKALELATVEQKRVYRRKGGEIDDIRDEFFALKKNGLDYDCFLCVKVTEENGSHTEDRERASMIYEHLKDKGYKPFFSEREIKGRTGSAYEALILYALYTSECMLIVCSDEEYLQTKWVKNEYTRFMGLMSDGGKERDSLTFVFCGRPIEKLPNGKRVQGIDLNQPDAYSRITEYVENHTPEAKAKREAVAVQAAVEAAARDKALAEQQKLIEEQRKELERLREQNSIAQNGNLSGSALLEMLRKAQEEESIAKRAEIEKRELLTIDKDKCIGCGLCARNCPENSIQRTEYIAQGHKLPSFKIDQESCIRCGECSKVCKFHAVETATERANRERVEQEAREKADAERKKKAEDDRKRAEEQRIAREKTEEEQRQREEERKYLAQFQIENGVLEKYIGKGEDVIIPDGVTSIGGRAFYNRIELKSVTIPQGVTSIEEDAFYDCIRLTSITIPNSVTSIGRAAFDHCTGLKSITIPNSVTAIGNSAFWGCCGLTNITIPNSVNLIGGAAFRECFRLTSIKIPNSVTSIKWCAFQGCTGLKSITIPDNVTSIGDDAFSGCRGLKSITIPDSVTSIGYGAFEDCTGLTSVTIPKRFDTGFLHANLKKIFKHCYKNITFTFT